MVIWSGINEKNVNAVGLMSTFNGIPLTLNLYRLIIRSRSYHLPQRSSNVVLLFSLLSLICLISCDDDKVTREDQPESAGLIDPCVLAPGPNCCELAYNGLCDEPYECFLGTDGDDCRGSIDLDIRCDETSILVGTPHDTGEILSEAFPFSWTDQEGEVSFTESPILLRLSPEVSGVSVSVSDGDLKTGLSWSLNGRPLLSFNDAITATGALPYHEQSAPEAGCLAVWPLVEGERLDAEADLLIVARSSAPIRKTLDVNVVLVGDLESSEAELEESLSIASRLYQARGGPRINLLDYFRLEGESVIPSEGEEINTLRAQDIGDDPHALQVYVISGFLDEEGTLGIAGGLPGPNGAPITAASGLVIAIEPHLTLVDGESVDRWTLDTALMGSTIAHELGHQLGLGHTTEMDGTTMPFVTGSSATMRRAPPASSYHVLNEMTSTAK